MNSPQIPGSRDRTGLPSYVAEVDFKELAHIETGFFRWSYKEQGGIPESEWDRVAQAQVHRQRVRFNKPFADAPLVYVAFQLIDTNSNQAFVRVATRAEEITAVGFELRVESWCDTKLFSFAVQWIAFNNTPGVCAVHGVE